MKLPTLIDNWKAVLRRAYSMRLVYAATLLSWLNMGLPYILPSFPPALAFAISIAVSAALALVTPSIGVARVVQQPKTLPEG